MSVTYIDLKTVPVDTSTHVSEITWIHEVNNGLETHHYFVDYPGAKELERQIIEVIGGRTLVRYSCRVVLQAFIKDLPHGNTVAARTKDQKDLLRSLIVAADLALPVIITFDDVLEIDGELSKIKDEIDRARLEAPKRFGNAL